MKKRGHEFEKDQKGIWKCWEKRNGRGNKVMIPYSQKKYK